MAHVAEKAASPSESASKTTALLVDELLSDWW
jgi:hypothetical protein